MNGLFPADPARCPIARFSPSPIRRLRTPLTGQEQSPHPGAVQAMKLAWVTNRSEMPSRRFAAFRPGGIAGEEGSQFQGTIRRHFVVVLTFHHGYTRKWVPSLQCSKLPSFAKRGFAYDHALLQVNAVRHLGSLCRPPNVRRRTASWQPQERCSSRVRATIFCRWWGRFFS
jgi:hypothetical protein